MHTVSDRTQNIVLLAEKRTEDKRDYHIETQQHPSVHHPLETSYDSAMDEPPQLRYHLGNLSSNFPPHT
jgi:hypothetical protein